MASRKKLPPPTEKGYANTKTIILRENDPLAVPISNEAVPKEQPGVWSRSLAEDLTLHDGDTVILKSSFVDTRAQAEEGIITITDDDIAALSITTGTYWQDSGNGIPIERYTVAVAAGDPNAREGIEYAGENSPFPQMDQCILSNVGVGFDSQFIPQPSGKNYILQNEFSDFTNTKLYLNTQSVDQTGAAVTEYSVRELNQNPILRPGTNYNSDGFPVAIRTNVPFTNPAVGSPPTASAGVGLEVSYTTTIPAEPSGIGEVVITAAGTGYEVNDTVELNQQPVRATHAAPPGSATNINARFTVKSKEINMTLEMKPNENYDTTKTTHEWFDYTIQVADLPTGTPQPTYQQPAAGSVAAPVPLTNIRNLVGLRLASNILDGNQFFLYPSNYSNSKNPKDTVDDNAYMATITSTVDALGNPEWTVTPNENWVRQIPATPAPNASPAIISPVEQGWVFAPKTAAQGNPSGLVNFNSAGQPGVYRVCTGIWCWIWVPGEKNAISATYPATTTNGNTGKVEDNYYNIELEYYGPGNAAGGGATKSKLYKSSKSWEPKVVPSQRLFSWYDAQFPKFVDRDRAGTLPETDPSLIQQPPKSQFPVPPGPPSPNRGGIGPNYPETKSSEYFAPCFLNNMIDTSSATQNSKNVSTFEPFIYNSNPVIEMGASDPDAQNFQPFRISSSGSLWKGGRDEMTTYQQCGFLQQDARGCIMTNTGKDSKTNPYVPQAIPPIWVKNSKAIKKTTMNGAATPEFKMTHECVISRPYIPGAGSVLTARTFTTQIADLPDVNIVAKDYTYSAWARTLTDALNRTPRQNLPLSNEPADSQHPVNAVTYTSGRLLTDTVQLGYQGRNFPSNRFGLDWDFTFDAARPQTYDAMVADSPFTSYFKSEQPYWISEDGSDLFAYKDGVPKPNNSALPSVDFATVDPILSALGDGQNARVYGANGPKWCGAETFSLTFNETSQAFEILQMHSNLYSSTTGSTIVKNFRSGVKGTLYPDGVQNLSVADQSGGVFITDWQPKELWEGRMNFSPNVKVHTGGALSPKSLNTGGFQNNPNFPNLQEAGRNAITLVRGLNVTGNFRAGTDFIDKRVNIPFTGEIPAPGATDAARIAYQATFIGGNYESPVAPFNLQTETNTPVTILGGTIIPTELADPFFMIEVKGINRNDIYGLDQQNSLISSIVGRYFATSNYTQGSSEGSIQYVHRGEPLTIRELSVRILNSKGEPLTTQTLKGSSALILEIVGEDVSIVQEQ